KWRVRIAVAISCPCNSGSVTHPPMHLSPEFVVLSSLPCSGSDRYASRRGLRFPGNKYVPFCIPVRRWRACRRKQSRRAKVPIMARRRRNSVSRALGVIRQVEGKERQDEGPAWGACRVSHTTEHHR